MSKPNEHKKDYHIRKRNDKNFVFHFKDNDMFILGEKAISFEIKKNIVSYCSEPGCNDIKLAFAHGEKTIFLCFIKKISLLKNIKLQHKKMDMSICMKSLMI